MPVFLMDLEYLGLALGFFGACSQAANYAFTKDCVEKYHLQGIRQLIAVHILMFAMVIIPFFVFEYWRFFSLQTVIYCLCIIIPYLLAQYLMIRALTIADSSIISPLLTIKVPILALISVLCFEQTFSHLQLLCVTVIICLGFYFSSLSGQIKLGPLCLIALACTCFSTSDIAMTLFMKTLPAARFHQISAGIAYEYFACAVFALPLMFYKPLNIHTKEVWQTKWIGLAWMLSMIGIVGCFNLAGVVEGNIIQTLRSVIGVIIAYLFYRQYIHDHSTFKKKIGIAIGMFIAVTVYYL